MRRPQKWPADAAIRLLPRVTGAVRGWLGGGPIDAAPVATARGEAMMDQLETAGVPDDALGDEKLSLLEVGVFVFLCLMSVATILTLTIKG